MPTSPTTAVGGTVDAFTFIRRRGLPTSRRVIEIFFFQAEDGIRDLTVTGVQTCALPISVRPRRFPRGRRLAAEVEASTSAGNAPPRFAPSTRARAPVGSTTWVAANVATKIGRASCRERG